ncbi:helix-turn-helix domain-containing protein [Streptococcus equi subsp. zooepidemicus]|uniref:helix-turn-helix domain-containing protein n=1 Tax=Streptococcus equi TaxID=1336 RepID=UPI0005C2E5E9|nr:helix-turn-helix transcriptional regulator [Streptococcus equi]KIS05498.1 repressor protein [Streptococcus equi subsp. zooepidemicus Sz5]MCD3374905.1 helix-turn-helix domain-containing protein [Streptococcus equi subsp. zooepidemicus]MCD3375048.1 helix-turn-helix domain-containing protein [Streptococcus equi subsp. zooepidemicus]MCD3375051.1 helix-turn-helix domain-containing protein [Streptococcus equi subsp. zooepidemicus]MDI6075526.1 helix-turn-helix transcriptional regulator [Streptococ
MAFFNYSQALTVGQIDIKNARLKAGKTQKELAKLIGVTKQTIINYEKGTTEPSWDRLQEIATALNVDIDTLFPYNMLGEKRDFKWMEHLERLENNWLYSRMAEEEVLLQKILDFAIFQNKLDKDTLTTKELNNELNLEDNNTMSKEDKISLIILKYEKEIQEKTQKLIDLYKDQSSNELDTIRFESTNI